MRIVFAAIVVLFMLSFARAESFKEIRWEDLTTSIQPADDPFFGLSFETKQNVEIVLEIAKLREGEESITKADQEREAAAISELQEGGLSAEEILRKNSQFMKKLALQRNSVRNEWNNERVRIPGYILPLIYDGLHVKDFLLVPFVGACIHVPPPPPNQIVFVTTHNGFKSGGLFEAVWVQGIMRVSSSAKNVYLKDGSADIEFSYTITADHVESYKISR